MSTFSLNNKSLTLINNILNNMRKHYTNYSVFLDETGSSGSVSIEVYKDGNYINSYFFYPTGQNTNIGSIALYGTQLLRHYETINKSKNIFGFRVRNIEMITQNTTSPFLDIYIENY